VRLLIDSGRTDGQTDKRRVKHDVYGGGKSERSESYRIETSREVVEKCSLCVCVCVCVCVCGSENIAIVRVAGNSVVIQISKETMQSRALAYTNRQLSLLL